MRLWERFKAWQRAGRIRRQVQRVIDSEWHKHKDTVQAGAYIMRYNDGQLDVTPVKLGHPPEMHGVDIWPEVIE